MGTGCSPASCHSRFCRQAVRITHSPIGTINPDRSATGMNRNGLNSPISGDFHRIRASTPAISPEPKSNSGWYTRNSSSSSAPPAARSRSAPARGWWPPCPVRRTGSWRALLGAVERQIGLLHQGLNVLAIRGIGTDAQAARDRHRLALGQHGPERTAGCAGPRCRRPRTRADPRP